METKGITCKIPLELHNRASEEIRETDSSMSKFIEQVITEHFEKGVATMMGKGRTLAFQVSEELFQRVKAYLAEYEIAYGKRLTQRDFVVGLIEQALEEADEEFEAARAARQEQKEETDWEAPQDAETDGDDEVPTEDDPADLAEESVGFHSPDNAESDEDPEDKSEII